MCRDQGIPSKGIKLGQSLKKKKLVQLQIQNVEVSEGASRCVTNVDKAATMCAKKIGLDLLCSTSVKGANFQMLMFEKLLALSMLQLGMLNYVVKHEKLLQCEDVCNSLALAWKGLKYGVGKDIYVVWNVVKAIVISTSFKSC